MRPIVRRGRSTPVIAVRKTLYNLYHILNHANMFGGGYAAQAQRMTAQFLAELR